MLLQFVRYSVVVTGDINFPTQIYFLEAALEGIYVKYSSNIEFNVSEKQPGMDPYICRLMNAFTHWTFNQSNGTSLICDLQGVGSILTDPQIIDMNAE
jgi:hypothetical protein